VIPNTVHSLVVVNPDIDGTGGFDIDVSDNRIGNDFGISDNYNVNINTNDTGTGWLRSFS
jgi:hypothetical protein